MTPRSIRRALERKAKKAEARKLRTPSEQGVKAGELSSSNQLGSSVQKNHGFRGSFFLAPAEDPAEWEHLKEQLVAEWQPGTETERNLVQMLAENFWLRKRSQILSVVAQQRTDLSPELQFKTIEMYHRNAGRHERAYQTCRKQLEAIAKRRDQEAIGFERAISIANEEHRRSELHTVKIQILKAKLGNREAELASNATTAVPATMASQAMHSKTRAGGAPRFPLNP